MIVLNTFRLKIIEILCNFFRSVIVLSPDDLRLCVYLCLNSLAPAYEGVELGIGDTILMKVVAQTTGRSMEKIKADVSEKGDLGIVAEVYVIDLVLLKTYPFNVGYKNTNKNFFI